MHHSKYRLPRFIGTGAAALTLLACGGGGGTAAVSDPGALTGLAATGAAIAGGAVSAKCAAGPLLSGSTNANGIFNLALTAAHTAPCMLQVIGGTPSATLYGFATSAGRVNITPLTDLIVAKALGSDPAAAFAAFDNTKGSSIAGNLAAAKTYVQAQVDAITGSSVVVDPLSEIFAVGDASDKLLDALGVAMSAAGKRLADLRGGAATGANLVGIVPPYVAAPPASAASASGAGSTGAVIGATGTASNGTPSVSVASCSKRIPAGDMVLYTGCSAAAVAAFANVTVTDTLSGSGKTCTASYANGMLTATDGVLTGSQPMDGSANASVTNYATNNVDSTISIMQATTIVGFTAPMVRVSWNAVGKPFAIQFGSTSIGGGYQLVTCMTTP